MSKPEPNVINQRPDSLHVTGQLSWKAAIALFACFAPCVPFLAVAFGYCFITPIHECGHLLACRVLGIQVVKVNWANVESMRVAGWRENVMGFMGGFSAASALCLIYVLVGRTFNMVSGRVAFRPRLSVIVASFSALIKAAVMVNIMVEVTSGILEGLLFLSVYRQVFGWPSGFIILLAFSCFSLFWQLRKLTQASPLSVLGELHGPV